MPALVIIGAQWGDEGKGKVTDFLAREADFVVRFQGGDNAGHTVVTGGNEYNLFLLPSGVFWPDVTSVLGNGMVIDPAVLLDEMDRLRAGGHSTERIRVSHAAHVVLPYHRAVEEAEEDRLGEGKIGTTRRGIGPAYLDKYARIGVRIGDLLEADVLSEKLKANVAFKNTLLEKVYGREGFSAGQLIDEYLGYGQRLRPYVTDTSLLLDGGLRDGKNVLFEGAQGTMLEIDYGTYPYVTSSYTTAGGACAGSGVGPTRIGSVIGVIKAFTSRVGNGPFPTELHDETGQYIRRKGKEYGTRTGRPRRMGWLDTVSLRMAARINGFAWAALTKLDTLAGLPKVRMCTAYRFSSHVMTVAPTATTDLAQCEAVYEEFDGWDEAALKRARTYDELPASVRAYVKAVEEAIGVEMRLIGTGQDRTEVVVKGEIGFGRG